MLLKFCFFYQNHLSFWRHVIIFWLNFGYLWTYSFITWISKYIWNNLLFILHTSTCTLELDSTSHNLPNNICCMLHLSCNHTCNKPNKIWAEPVSSHAVHQTHISTHFCMSSTRPAPAKLLHAIHDRCTQATKHALCEHSGHKAPQVFF